MKTMLVELMGAAALLGGIAWIYPPAALIAGGLGALWYAHGVTAK